MADYKEIWRSPQDATVIGYQHTILNKSFLIDPANMDYQEFLEWQTAGGVADPGYLLPEQQQHAIAHCETLLSKKLQADVAYDGDILKADKKHKDDITFRVYSRGKSKDIKVKKNDGSIKTVARNDIDTMLETIGDRDDLVIDNYQIAVAAINAAIDLAGINAAITIFESS